jgi:hypothetical protein
MGKYKWNLGKGSFCGLAALLKNFNTDLMKKFHADLNGKETQIKNVFC